MHWLVQLLLSEAATWYFLLVIASVRVHVHRHVRAYKYIYIHLILMQLHGPQTSL